MGTRGRWRGWIGGYLLVLVSFGLMWWNNPADVGGPNEAQRAWLALGFAIIGILIFVPPLSIRPAGEVVAQRTLIVCLAVFMSIALWWVGFLPSDPFGCSRVDAPDCHSNPVTRWRALGEVTAAWLLAFGITHALGSFIEKRREAKQLVV